MRSTICKKTFLSFVLVFIVSISSFAQQSLWVGQSYTFDVSSSVMGITANMSWSTNGGYLSLSGSGFYRTITVTQYFSGTATVTCEWDYKLTGNGSYTHTKRQVTISCRDNQVSISPNSMTMSPGETRFVSYLHKYDNQYTFAANAYFQSTNPSVVRVDRQTGKVSAVSVGTAYINVYSKISSVSPYCRVTVEDIEPTSISLPDKIELIRGEKMTLQPTFIPTNASASLVWMSSDPSIVSVTSEGEIYANRRGNAIITVRTPNNLSAQCNIIVDNPTLEIYCSHESGFLERNTPINLTASNPNAMIYYTLDGSTPTINSHSYQGPIIIDSSLTLNAIAICDDYYQSEILSRVYEISSLEIIDTNIIENGYITDNVLYLVFNEPIHSGNLFVGDFYGGGYLCIEIKSHNLEQNGGHRLFKGVANIIDNVLSLHIQCDDNIPVDVYIAADFCRSANNEKCKEINIKNVFINDYLNNLNPDLESLSVSEHNIILQKGKRYTLPIIFNPVICKYKTLSVESSDITVIGTHAYALSCLIAKEVGECDVKVKADLYNGNTIVFTIHIKVVDDNAGKTDIVIENHDNNVKIYDLQGRLRYQGDSNNIPPLPSSIYIFDFEKVKRKVLIK